MATRHYDLKSFNSRKSIGYLLKTAHGLMHDCMEAVFADHDINFIHWVVLIKLREGAAVTASDLCREMRHDNGALTRVLDHLQDHGYLERKRSDQDRRVITLELTTAGNRKLDEIGPEVIGRINDGLSAFTRAEFAEFNRLLNKMVTTLHALRASGEGS